MSLYYGDMGLCVIRDCDTLCWPLQYMLSWHFRNKINVIFQMYWLVLWIVIPMQQKTRGSHERGICDNIQLLTYVEVDM